MKVIPRETLDQIRSRLDIVEVVQERVPLTRAGAAFKARCPFHKEKTPSFHVNPARQIYHCFGCGAGGDVFRFVMEYEKVDFMTAVRMLARRAGVVVELSEDEQRDGAAKDVLLRLHDEAAGLYRRCLERDPSAEAARAYLKARRLDGRDAAAFRIGFAPDRSDSLLRWGQGKGYAPEVLETAGLALRGDPDRGGGWYDRFRNRVMFPIADEQGRVIGFSGRVLREEDSPAKYMNSPETPLFHKSRVLFALDRARRAMLEAKTAVLCEGQIDTIRCHLAGLQNAVAAQGTAVTEEHARILRRYADEVVLMLDADSAGQDAAIRSAEALMAAGLVVRLATLPPGEDPDSLILKDGLKPVQEAIGRAESVVDFQFRVLAARGELDSEAGRVRVARAVLETVARAPDAALQEELLKRASRRLGLSVEALRRDLRARGRRPSAAAADAAEPEAAPRTETVRPEERTLVEMLAADVRLAPWVKEHLPTRHIENPILRRIAELLLEHAGQPGWRLSSEAGDDAAFARLAAELEMAPPRIRKDFSAEKALQDVILQVWRNALQRERRDMLAQLAATDEGGRDALRARLVELTLHIKTLDRGWDAALPLLEAGI